MRTGRPRSEQTVSRSARPSVAQMEARTANAEANGTLAREEPPTSVFQDFLKSQEAADPRHAAVVREALDRGLRPNEVEAMILSDFLWMRSIVLDPDTCTDDRLEWTKLLIRQGATLATIVKGRATTNGKIPNGVIVVVNMPDGRTMPAIEVSTDDDDGDEIPID